MKRILLIVLLILLCSGCASTRDWYENNIEPVDQPHVNEPIFALMASDWVQAKDITDFRDDMWHLRDYYNTIYCPIDLAIRHNNLNNDRVRPHIEAGRTETAVTDNTVENIEYIYNKGFRVMIVMGNEPTVRGGLSENMSGLGFVDGIMNSDLYHSTRLWNEMHCFNSLYANSGNYLYGMMLYLEPSRSESIGFCWQLATHMRAMGFTGRIYSNGIGSGKWKGDATLDVRYSRSLNSLSSWMSSDNDLRNNDGMHVDANNAATVIPQMINAPGPDGWLLYFNEYKGNANGQTALLDYVWQYLPKIR